jgi:hypothetical protein
LIKVIEDSLFSKNENLVELYLRENKIVAVGPKAFQHLTKLKSLSLFGNPCMHPDVKSWDRNPQNLGIFFSAESDYRQWNNENNACVSSYSVQRCFNERNIEREKSFKIILVLSIIIILLIIVIIGLSFMNWKLKTKNADQKDQIIRLDRLAPKHIYEQVDQEPEPEPEYEEIQ